MSAVGAGYIVRCAVALSAELSHAVVRLVDRITGGRRDILVTRLTPRSAQLQVIQPRGGTAHEFLLTDTPTRAHRRERRKTVVLTETARTVVTERERNQITVVVAVVGFAEERDQRVAARSAIRLCLTRSGRRPHIRRFQYDEILFVAGEPLVYLAVQLRTQQEVGAVFADLQVIGDDRVPHPFEPVLLLRLYRVLVVRYHTLCYRIGEETLLLLRVVDTGGRADIQTLVGIDIDKRVSEHTPVGIAVVFVALQDRQRVLALRETAGRGSLGQGLAIGLIHRQQGVVLQHAVDKTARRSYLRRAAQREVLAYRHIVLQNLVVAVDTGGETVEIRRLDDALVLVITHREESTTLLSAVRHGYVIILYNTRARGLLEPIGVAHRHCSRLVHIFVQRKAVQHRLTLLVETPVVMITQYVGVRIRLTVVDIGLPERTSVLLRIQHFHAVHVRLNSHRGVHIHADLTLRAALGSNNDHTVRCARTVYTCRSGIFQHLDRLDIVGVQLVHSRFGRHSVDDIQRVVVVERAYTADTYRSSTRRITISSDIHSRDLTLQGLHRVVLLLLLQILGRHGGDSTRQIGFALGRITRHYHLLQNLAILRQLHFHVLCRIELLGLVAYVRHHDHGIGGYG